MTFSAITIIILLGLVITLAYLYITAKNNNISLIKDNVLLKEQQKYDAEKINDSKNNIDELRIGFTNLQATLSEKQEQNNSYISDIKIAENLASQNKEVINKLNSEKEVLSISEKESLVMISDLSSKNTFLNESLQTQKQEIERIQKDFMIEFENTAIEHKDVINKLSSEKEILSTIEKESLIRISNLSSENRFLNESLQTQKQEIERIQKDFKIEFENIATRIIEENSKKLTSTNKDNIDTILKPLGESINDFKAQIKTNLTEETKQRTSLQEHVKGLLEQTNMVTIQAENLATALKGKSKIRGNWGEMILESVLQKSGLTQGREYDRQKGTKDIENNTTILPDIIINLPNNRKIIVDSKVSLVDYETYSSTEDITKQEEALKRHIGSIKLHIDSLSSKEYNKKIGNSVDFTMMFVPIEPAYMTALAKDGELWDYAYKKGIMLVSPSNLMPCLKLVDDMWTKDKITRNAKDIVSRGEQLYNQLRLVMESFNKVGDALNKAQDEYSTAKTRIIGGKGNLIWQAETLRSMGIKPGKQIAEGEEILINMIEVEE